MTRMTDPERERTNSPPPPPPDRALEAEQPRSRELASAIGNQGVARVAGSAELQRSPAARELVEPEAGAAGPAAESASAELADAPEEMTFGASEHADGAAPAAAGPAAAAPTDLADAEEEVTFGAEERVG